jgi:hypothetical protein
MAADLAWLEKSFNWEVRVMWLVPVGVVFFVISEDVAIIFMGVAMLGILITDSLFTDIATTAFFRPWPLAEANGYILVWESLAAAISASTPQTFPAGRS